MDNTLQLNQQGGGRIDIPLPEGDSGISIPILNYKNSYTATSTSQSVASLNITNSPGSRTYMNSSILCYIEGYYYQGASVWNDVYRFEMNLDELKEHIIENFSLLEDGGYLFFICGLETIVYSIDIFIPHSGVTVIKSGSNIQVSSITYTYSRGSSNITTDDRFILLPVSKTS